MDKMAKPIMYNLSMDKLKEVMPVELSKRTDNAVTRKEAAYLEGFARMFCGMSIWLNNEDGNEKEKALRNQYREWVIKGLKNGVNPSAKDYMNFTQSQSLVDAAFLALGLIRCPWLWNQLDLNTKQQLINAFNSTKK